MFQTSQHELVPLKFIVRGVEDGPKSKKQAKVIASHVSGTYKRWRKGRRSHVGQGLVSSSPPVLKPPLLGSREEDTLSAEVKPENEDLWDQKDLSIRVRFVKTTIASLQRRRSPKACQRYLHRLKAVSVPRASTLLHHYMSELIVK